MKKALLYLDEDLASSMALRFAADQARQLDMTLQVFHVVAPEGRAPEQMGWVNRSMEKVLLAAGVDKVNRLVRTENIDYPKVGEPRIALGDKDQEVIRELAGGEYSLYVEGFLASQEAPADFARFLTAERLQNATCPLLLVKNLVDHAHLLLLLDREMDAGRLVSRLTELYGSAAADIDLTVLLYRQDDGQELVFQQQRKNDAVLTRVDAMLAEYGWSEPEWQVVQGPPDKTAEYMRGHGLVATAFPGPASAGAALLGHLANPVLLFPEAR